ncbi:shikimate dehydrogenase [Roseateles sp. BYS180W]|uniref:Shikimate dehydrogenase (NADP(+)) n=1 Tax=Roseateles rivi TaxID=3299028 RepID=A0ABW7FW87_9BURK
MNTTPANTPALYAVVGNPVAHSRSPAIHQAFAAQTQQTLSYERVLSPLEGLRETLQALAARGAHGCNITVPFKFEAQALAARLTPRAAQAAAVNTLRFDAQGWLGDNTDGAGLVADIQVHAQTPLRGRRVLLLGAGGAAAGVLGALLQEGPSALRVLNRNPAKAEALVHSHQALAAEHGVALSAGALDQAQGRYEVLINATSASLDQGTAPLPAHLPPVLEPGALALDMMYGPAALPFLQWAREQVGPQGQVRDGLGMLVEQAAEAFALWRGVRPDTAPVLAALRQQVDQAAEA